jgi:ubiquinone/menaquinone biosynthesis C-methylase UbiE
VLNLPDFVRAGNQAGDPRVYEIENAAIDHDGALAEALEACASWTGRDLLDLGCGSGYWLPGYAQLARSVIGVEPDPSLLAAAAARDLQVQVLHGSAEHIPLPDASVDVVHARFAYFFPPGRDAGLAEVMRVLRPGGALVVIDNDHQWGQFAELLSGSSWAAPQGRADDTNAWWADRGASRRAVRSSWQFESRADLEAVLRLEFPSDIANAWLAEHADACGLSYGYVLFTVRRSP